MAKRLLALLVTLSACGTIERQPGDPGDQGDSADDSGDDSADDGDGTTAGDAAVIDARPNPPDACVATGEETCNGLDDDCDDLVDEGFDGTGVACDGADTDRCEEGVTVCLADGSGITCSDVTGDITETCNGKDDDCDDTVDNGFGVGASCDGPDGDQCADGAQVCTSDGTAVLCEDPGPDLVELCNGADDDCDSATDEGFPLGQSCDGNDSDVCFRGTFVCNGSGTGVVCSETESTPEICDGIDNDCDGDADEEEPNCANSRCCGGICCPLNQPCCDGGICCPFGTTCCGTECVLVCN